MDQGEYGSSPCKGTAPHGAVLTLTHPPELHPALGSWDTCLGLRRWQPIQRASDAAISSYG